MSGYLTLGLGNMRADKSVFACRRATRYADLGQKVLYVRSSKDEGRETTGGDGNTFTSHSSSNCFLSQKVDKISCASLGEVDASEYDFIVIDEGQFFDDLVEVVVQWVDVLGKRVHVAGLDGSFLRTPIGHVLELIPYADYYEKFSAKCEKCLEEDRNKFVDAPFTLYESLTQSQGNNIIKPGNKGYVPVCRYHYNKYK